jgi:LysR family hydrogen peroxide-inducible transcriptional activator
MNLRDLGYLVAVADQRHFGRAAEACHVSQPTLSAQLKKLEDYLGVTLFERTNKRVTITAVGAEMVRHARLALEQEAAIKALAAARQAPLTGTLRLGIIPTLGPYLLPWIMRPLAERFPDLKLVLDEDLTENLVGKLKAHELDAALLALPLEDRELESLALFVEPFWVAYPPGHRLETMAEIREADLTGANLLLLAEGHCLRDQALSLCRGAARTAGPGDLRATSLETLRQMVAAGYGCTLLPALAVRGQRRRNAPLDARPLELPRAEREIGIVFRRSFPRRPDLALLGDLILAQLPDGVTGSAGRQLASGLMPNPEP